MTTITHIYTRWNDQNATPQGVASEEVAAVQTGSASYEEISLKCEMALRSGDMDVAGAAKQWMSSIQADLTALARASSASAREQRHSESREPSDTSSPWAA